MNYEEARQIGPNGPAPGKWNWSNANDSIAPNPYTSAPCAWPDAPIPTDWQFGQPLKRTGRERCDHDTREAAERHRWTYELDGLRIEPIDLATAESRSRCDVPDCSEWETHRAFGQWMFDHLCDTHANRAGLELVHPFSQGRTVIHL